MKADESSLRPYGQRSITSLTSPLLSRLRPAIGSGDGMSRPGGGRSLTLSEFLNRKLANTKSGAAASVREKKSSFSSIGWGGRGADVVEKGKEIANGDAFVLPDYLSTFRQSDSNGGEGGCGGLIVDERSCEMKKRRKSSEEDPPGVAERHSTSKYLLVLGDDPKPMEKKFKQISLGENPKPFFNRRAVKRRLGSKSLFGDRPKTREKRFKQHNLEGKPKPFFNHYASGNGWWDCGMEGIDTEEVGCNETWEGMGSTTLGGLEWH